MMKFYDARDVKPTDVKRDIVCLMKSEDVTYWVAGSASYRRDDWDEVLFWAYLPARDELEELAW